ncbi:MAG: right-handed parallel beta-helix repeat-containing protein [Verrucomicrobiales bacterium]|nr:right-handed parallel beta-helix repeat-containing protein [Verrucomicrobiales bacterium]
MNSGRRLFLSTLGLTTAGASLSLAGDIKNPRATSGDSRVEPDWEKRLTITVGQKSGADLVGSDEKVLQAAVDWAARHGGGTVKVLPGEYRLRNAVHLASNVRILGSGEDSVLKKEASVKTKLKADSDWFDQEITLENADGFRIGDGICLQTKNPHHGGKEVWKGTLIAQTGNRFKLSKALRKNFWLMGESTAATLFPILNCEFVEDVVIENIALDGNRENNENLNGNYAGCIFAQDCSRLTFRDVTAREYNGDGMSWQICHDVVVENCHSHDNAGLGLHPGSGSQRPIIRNNKLERNRIGIFFCWGVRNGLAEKNKCLENSGYGVSIGHRDTDNRIIDNDIIRSGKAGVLFRPERGKDFAPHRNLVENNRITDSGGETGIAVDVQGEVESITLKKNEIRETREPAKRVGVRIGPKTRDIKLVENQISGFATEVARPEQ